MSGLTVDGLISGLGTSDLIKQLMEVERAPITRMEVRKEGLRSKIELLQDLNTRLLNLKGYADNLKEANMFRVRTATSSNQNVLNATAAPGADLGKYYLTVERVALAHQLQSINGAGEGYDDETANSFGTGTITVSIGGDDTSITINSSNNSLIGIRDALNDAKLGIRASVVSAEGKQRLWITSAETGEAGEITFTVNLTGEEAGYELDFAETQPAQNARVLLGSGASPLVYEGSSNLVTDLITGVTLDLVNASPDPVVLDITANTEAIEGTVREFINTYNETIVQIKALTYYDDENNDRGPFLGNFTVSNLRSQMERVLTNRIVSLNNQKKSSAPYADPSARKFGIGSFTLRVGEVEETITITEANNSLQGIANAITNSGLPVFARTVSEQGGYFLEINSQIAGSGGEIVQVSPPPGSALLTGGEYADLAIYSSVPAQSAPDTNSLPMLGITLTKEGYLQITDEGKFKSAIENNLPAVRQLFTGEGSQTSFSFGVGRELSSTLGNITRFGQGIIWSQTNEYQRRINDIDQRINRMETMMELRQQRLLRQFTRLEEVLGELQTQSNWLAQQIMRMQGNTVNQ